MGLFSNCSLITPIFSSSLSLKSLAIRRISSSLYSWYFRFGSKYSRVKSTFGDPLTSGIRIFFEGLSGCIVFLSNGVISSSSTGIFLSQASTFSRSLLKLLWYTTFTLSNSSNSVHLPKGSLIPLPIVCSTNTWLSKALRGIIV